jgi:NADH-quinone oxidoreductase subunit J
MTDAIGNATIPGLGWSWGDLLFLALAAVLLGAALTVVLNPDIIRSGLAMIVTFAALAGVYLLLGAPLVAAAQVLIYIGAISVLVLFAIMLTQTKAGPIRLVFHHQAWAAAVAALVLAALLIGVVTGTAWPHVADGPLHTATDALARMLFDQYVLPLEIVSVLLLASVVGGIFLARRDDSPREER